MNHTHPQARPVTSLFPEPCFPWTPKSGAYLSHPYCHHQNLALFRDCPEPSLALFLFNLGPALWSHSLGAAEHLGYPIQPLRAQVLVARPCSFSPFLVQSSSIAQGALLRANHEKLPAIQCEDLHGRKDLPFRKGLATILEKRGC